MADSIGAESIPLQLPLAGEEVADPALSRLAAYFQAVVNAKSAAVWQTVLPNSLPAAFAFTHDPKTGPFNERQLPALFLDRPGGGEPQYERLSEDYDLTHSVLRLLWVFPPVRQEFQKARDSFANGLAVVLQHAIEIGRDPSYVFAGDPDPKAAAQGSVIYRVAGLWEIRWIGYKTGLGLDIKTISDTRHYYCLDAKIAITERRIIDIVADFPAASGLDLTITTPDKARDLAVGKL